MYETEELIFVQMQKTGSTHIASLLAEVFQAGQPNQGLGKHWPASAKQLSSGKVIAASIRNPWDWYVSLWSFGAEGKGGLRSRLCSQDKIYTNSHVAKKSPGTERCLPSNQQHKDAWSNKNEWDIVYSDKTSIHLFRRWLKMILNPVYSSKLGEEYHQNEAAQNYGFMTHRYLRLCCCGKPSYDTNKIMQYYPDLKSFDEANCYINHFIRLESLSQDVCRLITKFRPLSDADMLRIHQARPLNSSTRTHSLSRYYDEPSTKLVMQRDELIINKFGYNPPSTAPCLQA
jgi:hypothetical protein